MASGPITSWQIDEEIMETVTDFIFLGSKITVGRDCSLEFKTLALEINLLLGRKAMTNLSSVRFSCSVMSDSLRPHQSQHARPPCPSPTPRVRSNSRPSSQWCHPAISSSVVPFSTCPQPLPASASFPVSQLFAWGGQSIGVSASTSVLPMNIQDWFPLGLTGLILLSKGTLKSLQHHNSKASILWHSVFFMVQLSHPYTTTGKTIALTNRPLSTKQCLCFLICCLIWL